MSGPETLTDLVTGLAVPDVGAERRRQDVERFLLEKKGWDRAEIRVDFPVNFELPGMGAFHSAVDLALFLEGAPFLAVKVAAGSIDSWERMALAAARIMAAVPAPLAAVCDGRQALILDAATGRRFGRGMEMIPHRDEAPALLAGRAPSEPLPPERIKLERIIFRSYDADLVNRARK